MPFTLTMPKLSPTMETGTIAKWRVKEGALVKAGDVLFEVATDKATVEHNALDEGYLRKILIPNGGEAVVNQAVAIFTETKDESIEGYKPEGVQKQEKKVETTTEAKKEEVAKSAAAAGGLAMPAFVPAPPLEDYAFKKAGVKVQGRILASPLARKLAEEKGIDISTVKGSGPHGRIMSRDIDLGQPDATVTFGRDEEPEYLPGAYEEEPLSPMRKMIGQRLQESKTFIPHFYVTQEINAEPMISLREQLKTGGIKISFNDLIVRGAALALREHPEVNSGFNTVNNTIIRFKTIDISIAVSIEAGLITPIVRYADFKNLGEISTEVRELADKARKSKLAKEEYTGGSFTISNLGMYGITEFVAVINPPQAAILAVGGIEDRPIVKNNTVVPGKTLCLTLSADHRVIDGSHAAQFLKSLQKYLENPSLLLL